MRLAGTARQYSKKAMPQLISTTCHRATLGNLNWPYQAKVIKTLEQNSSTMGTSWAMAKPFTKRQGKHRGTIENAARTVLRLDQNGQGGLDGPISAFDRGCLFWHCRVRATAGQCAHGKHDVV